MSTECPAVSCRSPSRPAGVLAPSARPGEAAPNTRDAFNDFCIALLHERTERRRQLYEFDANGRVALNRWGRPLSWLMSMHWRPNRSRANACCWPLEAVIFRP